MFKIITLIITISIVATTKIKAQESKNKNSNIGFIYPISNNGKNADKISNVFSFNLLGGVSKTEYACTVSGIFNYIKDTALGLQLTGTFNYIGKSGFGVAYSGILNYVGQNYIGFMNAGAANYVKGNVTGFQLAGLLNKATNISGIQMAGLINISKKVKGLQVSGFMNIAEESNYPIGFINLIKNGEKFISIEYDYLENGSILFKSGSKKTYGIIGFGNNAKINEALFVLGLGYNINLTSVFKVKNELKANYIINQISNNNFFNSRFSVLPSFSFSKKMEVYGGISFDYLNTHNSKYLALFNENKLWSKKNNNQTTQIQAGYSFGLSYRL